MDAQQLEALKCLSATAPPSSSSENRQSPQHSELKQGKENVQNIQGSITNTSEPQSTRLVDKDGVEGDCVETESAVSHNTLPRAKNEEPCSPGDNSVLETSISSPTSVTDSEDLSPPVFIEGKVIVYAALSGLVSFLPDGSVHGCNHHFALMLFGFSQQELLKKVWLHAVVGNWS